jgi:hypothetical protein
VKPVPATARISGSAPFSSVALVSPEYYVYKVLKTASYNNLMLRWTGGFVDTSILRCGRDEAGRSTGRLVRERIARDVDPRDSS